MKKLLIIVILFLFTSCGIIIPAVKVTDFADFREFKDFYFTESNSVSFQFPPLGIVSAVRVSGDEEITTQIKNHEDVIVSWKKEMSKYTSNGWGSMGMDHKAHSKSIDKFKAALVTWI